MNYKISGYEGNAVFSGEVKVQDGRISVPVRLPRGYYEITFAGQPTAFGIASIESHQGPGERFFGVDAVLNWLDRRDFVRQELVKIMKRTGIGMARERISWGGINPKPANWNWNHHDRTRELRQMYEREGIPVLEMFHDSGASRGVSAIKTIYPQNLQQIVVSWPEIWRNLKGSWGGLEVWNEPEGRFGSGLPPDQYLPVVKAMRYTMQHNKITAPLGGGVFMGLDPSDFHRFCVLNGMLDMVDFVSFHDYQMTTSLERVITLHHDWLRRSGAPAIPLWLTECGFPWNTGPGRPPRTEDARSAAEITGKAVEAKACGLFTYMPFCLAFYEEGGVKSFSMMGKEVTPLRSMAAYAQCIRALTGRDYLGDLNVVEQKLLRSRVFGKPGDSTVVVVLYTGDTVRETQVTLPGKILRVEGIDGRFLPEKDGQLQIPDGLAYVWMDSSEITGHLKKDTVAAQLLQESRKNAPEAKIAGPVVLQHCLTAGQMNYSALRYLVAPDKAGKLKIVIRAHNLSGQVQTIRLRTILPGETEKEFQSRERTVSIDAKGIADVEWIIDAAPYLSSTEVKPLMISGEYADGTAISPVAIPLLREGTLKEQLTVASRQIRLPILELKRWETNITAHGKSVMAVQDGSWTMDAKFKKPGERWTYPKFQVKDLDLCGTSGLLLRCRARNPASVRLMLWERSGGGYWTSSDVIPADGQWHVIYVPFREFEPLPSHPDKQNGKLDLNQIVAVSVGMHDSSTELHNVLELSDLLAVKYSTEGEKK